MAKALTPDICVIGASAAGIAVATGAAAVGARVLLVDALSPAARLATGSLAHGTLAAAGRQAQAVRDGVGADAEQDIDFKAVMARVGKAVAEAAPAVSVERLATQGVTVIVAPPVFVGRGKLLAGETEIRARRYVLAMDGAPVVPTVPGLDDVGFLTPDTVLDLSRKPAHLVILGADGAALELAQVFNRLGTQVTLLADGPVLPQEDPEMVAVVVRRLRMEGIDLREGVKVTAVERRGKTGVRVLVEDDAGAGEVNGGQILVSAGRAPDLEALGAKKARIALKGGVADVSAMLRTTNSRVYAIGGAAGTWCANAALRQAGFVLKALLFRLPAKDREAAPRLVRTDPPLARVGLTEAEAARRHRRLTVTRVPFSEMQNARAAGQTEGHIKLVSDRGGRLLGVAIVGAGADEAIGVWALTLAGTLRIEDVAGWTLPDATRSEIGKKAAMAYLARRAPGPMKRTVARFLRVFG